MENTPDNDDSQEALDRSVRIAKANSRGPLEGKPIEVFRQEWLAKALKDR